MGAPKAMSLMLNYQVPAEEVIARIKKLNEYIHIPGKSSWRCGRRAAT